MWAVVMGVLAVFAGAASAHAAQTGGIGDGTGAPSENTDATGGGIADCAVLEFGQRPLQLGDCGSDVQTLNWLLKSKPFGGPVVPDVQFGQSTDDAVKTFQQQAGLSTNGVVDKVTRKALKKSMHKSIASWYGPGFFGNQTACGQTLKPATVGVAHRKLPCGTKVTFYAHGEWLRTEVIDRGPFIAGRTWDLTQAAAQELEVTATEPVRSAVIAGSGSRSQPVGLAAQLRG